MKPFPLDTGRQLGSVAMRYRNPFAMGDRTGDLLDGCRGPRKPMGPGIPTQDKDIPLKSDVSRLEALLFLSRQPQTSRKLAQLAGLADGTKARTLVRTLNQRYDGEDSAFRIEEVAGGFQLMTRSKLRLGCGDCTPRRRTSVCRRR